MSLDYFLIIPDARQLVPRRRRHGRGSSVAPNRGALLGLLLLQGDLGSWFRLQPVAFGAIKVTLRLGTGGVLRSQGTGEDSAAGWTLVIPARSSAAVKHR